MSNLSVSTIALTVAALSGAASLALSYAGLTRLRAKHPSVWERYGRPQLFDRVKPPQIASQFLREVFNDLNDPALKRIFIAIWVNCLVGLGSVLTWWLSK